jgi:hypothetical protein
MRHRSPYVAEVRFTCEEWDLLDRVAAARRITVEELIREELRLAPLGAGQSTHAGSRHLRLVRSDLVGG